jgi:hypothetical protein
LGTTFSSPKHFEQTRATITDLAKKTLDQAEAQLKRSVGLPETKGIRKA